MSDDFGLFEAAETSDSEIKLAAQEQADKLNAAIYDVRAKYGPFLYASTGLDDFDNRVALVKSDMMKTVMAHVPPVTGTMRRVVKACKAEYKQLTAAGTGGLSGSSGNQHDNWVYNTNQGGGSHGAGAVFPGPGDGTFINASGMRQRTPEYNAWVQSLKTAEHLHDDPALVPAGDFEGYLNSVAGDGPAKVDSNNFNDNPNNGSNFGESSGDNFAKDKKNASVSVGMYQDWCHSNGLKVASRKNLEYYAQFVSEPEFRAIEAAITQQAAPPADPVLSWITAEFEKTDDGKDDSDPIVKLFGEGVERDCGDAKRESVSDEGKDTSKKDNEKEDKKPFEKKESSVRTAGGGVQSGQELFKAEESIMNLLNTLAEEFQTSVAPLQQAIQAIEYAKSVQQQANPLAVMPGGGLNVLPPQDGPAMGQPGFADPAALLGGGPAGAMGLGPQPGAGAPPVGPPPGAPAGPPPGLGGPPDAGATPPDLAAAPLDPMATAGPPQPDPTRLTATHKLREQYRSRLGFNEASRKEAWSGWGPSLNKATDEGWNWNHRLNGYINEKREDFPCTCGQKLATPGFHHCPCGKIWNSYAIGGSDRLASNEAERYIAREIPARENVIMARKNPKALTEQFLDNDTIDDQEVKPIKQAKDDSGELQDDGMHPDDENMTITDKQKSKIDKGEQPGKDDVKTNTGDGSDADGDKKKEAAFAEAFALAWDAREAARERRDVTVADSDGDGDDISEATMRPNPSDWYRRRNDGKWTK